MNIHRTCILPLLHLLLLTMVSCTPRPAGSPPAAAGPVRPPAVDPSLPGPECGEAALQRALKPGAEGRHAEALTALETLAAACPPDARVHAWAGHHGRLAGEPERALAQAGAAVRLDPSVAWYHVSLALCAADAEAWELAFETAARALALPADQVGADNTAALRLLLGKRTRVYEITWELDPAKGHLHQGRMWLPLPTDGLPTQRRLDVRIEGAVRWGTQVVQGNELAWFEPAPGRRIRLFARVRTGPPSFRRVLREKPPARFPDPAALSAEVAAYLGATPRVDPRLPGVAALARTLKAAAPIETVTRVLDWMRNNVEYRITGFTTVDEVLARRHGECGGQSALIVALLRACGLPAREVWGVIEDLSPGRDFAPAGHLKGHLWVEVFLGDAGWVPLERDTTSRLGNVPPHYVRMTHLPPSDDTAPHRVRPVDQMILMGGDLPKFSNVSTE